MDRIIIKPRLYRLAKAGKIQLMGGGRYSTVTQEVKDKKEKLKTLTYLGCAQESAMNVGFAGISGFLVGEQILSRA